MNVERKTTPACVLPCTHTLKAACEAVGVALVGKEANRTVGMMSCARIVTLVTNLRCCDDDRAACDFCMRFACGIDRSQKSTRQAPSKGSNGVHRLLCVDGSGDRVRSVVGKQVRAPNPTFRIGIKLGIEMCPAATAATALST